MTFRTRLSAIGLAALVAAVAGGCSNDELPFAPANCLHDKPVNGYVNVEVTLNAQNPQVIVEVYTGPIEDARLVVRDTVGVSQFSYQLSVDRKYTVAARYLEGVDTVLVIGADDIETSQTEYQNDSCWEVTDARVDVRLKS